MRPSYVLNHLAHLLNFIRQSYAGRPLGAPRGAPSLILFAIFAEKLVGAAIAGVISAFALLSHAEGPGSPLVAMVQEATGPVGRALVLYVTRLLTPGMLVWGILAGLYAMLLTAEGVGLLLGKRWAGALVLAESAVAIPLEIVSFISRPHLGEGAILAANIAIFLYIWQRFKGHGRRLASQPSATDPSTERR